MSELQRVRRCLLGSNIPVFFIVILCLSSGISHARFLEPEAAEHWPHVFRSATVATATMGTTFLDSDNLGNHTYRPNGTEKTGIIYTCKGGHIDIAHLRKAADWTANIAFKTRENIQKGHVEFSYKLYEPSIYRVTISYPKNWNELIQEQQDAIANEVSIGLAQHFAFTALTWHEVLTWFGYKTLGVLSEFESAFSWEDMYSNLLGTRIAVQALRDPNHTFSEAMTIYLDEEVKKLGGQSKKVSRKASNEVRGLWWSYNMIFLSMKKRNFDIGLDDGYITPWLVPSIKECKGAEPVSYPIPTLDFLEKFGFEMKLEIELHEFEAGKILKVAYPEGVDGRNRIEPAVHMPIIMQYLRKRAIRRWGPYFDNPRVKNSKSNSQDTSPTEDYDDIDAAYAFGLEDVCPITEWWLDGNPFRVYSVEQ